MSMTNKTKQANARPQRQRRKRVKQQRGPTRGLPLPVSTVAKLRYVEVFYVTTTANVLQSFYTYQTSAYDPRSNLGGHQPYYFDQFAALYQRYRVDRLDYRITFATDSAVGHFYYMACSSTATPEGSTAVELLEELPFVKRSQGNAGGGPRTIRGTLEPHVILGVPKLKYQTDDTFSALVGSNPVNMAYLTPYFWSGPTAGDAKLHIRLELTFTTTFFELARPGQS